MNNYISKAKTVGIKFTSRASVCIDKNYYTVEACEERIIPDLEDIDLKEERQDLWDTVNAEVDHQIEDILKSFAKR